MAKKLVANEIKKSDRNSQLAMSQIITLPIYFHIISGFRNFRYLYNTLTSLPKDILITPANVDGNPLRLSLQHPSIRCIQAFLFLILTSTEKNTTEQHNLNINPPRSHMGITRFIIEKATWFIDTTGHAGIAILMMFESMIVPIPSEAVMPFAGWLIAENRFTFWGVAVSSTTGSIVGSLVSYYIGYYGGRPLIEKFGKYLLLNHSDLDATERFFSKYGSAAIFIGRFIPVVRHLISIPAGAGKMKLMPFCIYTIIGASAWNMFLAWVGFKMEGYRELIHQYSRPVDVIVILVILAFMVYFVKSHLKRG